MPQKARTTQQSDSRPPASNRNSSTADSTSKVTRTDRQSSLKNLTFAGKVRRILQDPAAFREFQRSLPDWTEEAGAFSLIIFGILTFASLLNPSGELVAPIANALTVAFGNGAYLIAFIITLMGIWLLLPRAGINIRLNWTRLLAVEVLFLMMQGLFHLLAFPEEPRALAREGGGGGYVGWSISSIVSDFIGETLTIILFLIIVLVSLGVLMGIRRQEVRAVVLGFSDFLAGLANQLRPEPAIYDDEPVYQVRDKHIDDVDEEPVILPRKNPMSDIDIMAPGAFETTTTRHTGRRFRRRHQDSTDTVHSDGKRSGKRRRRSRQRRSDIIDDSAMTGVVSNAPLDYTEEATEREVDQT